MKSALLFARARALETHLRQLREANDPRADDAAAELASVYDAAHTCVEQERASGPLASHDERLLESAAALFALLDELSNKSPNVLVDADVRALATLAIETVNACADAMRARRGRR